MSPELTTAASSNGRISRRAARDPSAGAGQRRRRVRRSAGRRATASNARVTLRHRRACRPARSRFASTWRRRRRRWCRCWRSTRRWPGSCSATCSASSIRSPPPRPTAIASCATSTCRPARWWPRAGRSSCRSWAASACSSGRPIRRSCPRRSSTPAAALADRPARSCARFRACSPTSRRSSAASSPRPGRCSSAACPSASAC